MIRVEQLSKTYGRRAALTDVSFDVSRGQRVGVAGQPGSGRTTLLRAIATLIPPTAGRIVVDGLDGRRDPFATRRKVFLAGHAPQSGGMALGECLRLVATARGGRFDDPFVAAVDDAARLSHSRQWRDLSVAEQRLFAVALAAVSGAPVLLFDDLFRGCGDGERQAISRILDAVATRDVTIVAAAEPHELSGVCDRVVHLREGRVWS